MKKIAIIGAGPAGIFAAYRLANYNNNLDITIFEKGKEIQNRKCAKIEKRQSCIKCSPCNIVSGVGGAGLFSDGKLIYSNKTGNNLPELIGDEKSQHYEWSSEGIYKQVIHLCLSPFGPFFKPDKDKMNNYSGNDANNNIAE